MTNTIGQIIKAIGAQFKVIDIFHLTPEEVTQRLRSKIQLCEIVAVVFCTLILTWFIIQSDKYRTYYDLQNFLSAGRGDFSHYYYAYWAVPVFKLLAKLSHPYPFVIVGIANILGACFAIRVFGGKIIPLLISVHTIYILSQGQITGIIVGGFALFIAGLLYRKWYVAGLGMLIAMIKFQMGVIPVLTLMILWDCPWKDKLKTLIIPSLLIGFSFLLYPGWIFNLFWNIQNAPPFAEGSISLWQWIGPTALVLWIIPIFFRPSKSQRFTLLLTANALALPYFQQTDLLIIFSMFSGFGAVTASFPFLIPTSTPWTFIRLLFLIPFGIYFKQIFDLSTKLSKV